MMLLPPEVGCTSIKPHFCHTRVYKEWVKAIVNSVKEPFPFYNGGKPHILGSIFDISSQEKLEK